MTQPHIDDLLADPIIQMVMHADHVEPLALKGLMTAAARRPARALAFASVRLPGQARPLRLEPPSAYKRGQPCFCC